jgi:hypothetical protein
MRRVRPFWPLLIIAAFVLVFGACTASQFPVAGSASVEPVPGFWRGLWQGFIAPITFFVSLLSDEVRIYAYPNTGRWYDFGFMLGIHGFSGGLFAGSRSQRWEREK